ncbi:MAG: hypothetical protein IT285_15000 [Bdellovibrionales bacterium]|nr:hypothetical protein [Bdellovibrionales bacterium]
MGTRRLLISLGLMLAISAQAEGVRPELAITLPAESRREVDEVIAGCTAEPAGSARVNCFRAAMDANADTARLAHNRALSCQHTRVRELLTGLCTAPHVDASKAADPTAATLGQTIFESRGCFHERLSGAAQQARNIVDSPPSAAEFSAVIAQEISGRAWFAVLYQDQCAGRLGRDCFLEVMRRTAADLEVARAHESESYDHVLRNSALMFECARDSGRDPGCIDSAWVRGHLVVDSELLNPPTYASCGGEGATGGGAGGSGAGDAATARGELETWAGELSMSDVAASARGPARTPTDPLVNLGPWGFSWSGGMRYECPNWAADYNCFPASGPWAHAPGAVGGSSPLANAAPDEVRALYGALSPTLFTGLADESLTQMGESFIVSLASHRSGQAASIRAEGARFMAAASCLAPERRSALQRSIDTIAIASNLPGRLATHREQNLAPDLITAADALKAAEETINARAPRLANDGDCGFLVDPHGSRSECRMLYLESSAAQDRRRAILDRYPFLTLRVGEQPEAWRRIAAATGPIGARRAAALVVYDEAVVDSREAAIRRATEVCENADTKIEAGRAALLNRNVSEAYLGANADAGWVFCSAYADLTRLETTKDALITSATMGFTVLSIMATGGVAGVVLAAADVGMTAFSAYDRHFTAVRRRDDFLAGVGELDEYLAAQESLRTFYRDLAVDVGLNTVGLAGEALMLRQWVRARRMARIAETARLPAETDRRLLSWYRSRLRSRLGDAARALSEADLRALARMEDEGFDLASLAGGNSDSFRRAIASFETPPATATQARSALRSRLEAMLGGRAAARRRLPCAFP